MQITMMRHSASPVRQAASAHARMNGVQLKDLTKLEKVKQLEEIQ